MVRSDQSRPTTTSATSRTICHALPNSSAFSRSVIGQPRPRIARRIEVICRGVGRGELQLPRPGPKRRNSMDEYTINRFRKFIKTDLDSGCLVWQGSRHRQGYGQFRYLGERWLSHRVAWQLHHGDIPKGMCVLHKCDNPPCVNIDHLFIGTARDNARDRDAKGRHHNPAGEAHYRAGITEKEVIRMRALYESGECTQKDLCEEFGITCPHVWLVVNRKSWRHI